MIEDRSYGVVVVFENKFLIIKQTIDYWGFPKGHAEGEETSQEAALRELKEETGIIYTPLDAPSIFDEYTFTWEDGKDYHKIVEYFVGTTDDDTVTIEPEEITEYKWASFEEALQVLTYDNSKEVLKKAKIYLDEYERSKSEK